MCDAVRLRVACLMCLELRRLIQNLLPTNKDMEFHAEKNRPIHLRWWPTLEEDMLESEAELTVSYVGCYLDSDKLEKM